MEHLFDLFVLVSYNEILNISNEVRLADDTYFIYQRTCFEYIDSVLDDFFTCDFHKLFRDVIAHSHS